MNNLPTPTAAYLANTGKALLLVPMEPQPIMRHGRIEHWRPVGDADVPGGWPPGEFACIARPFCPHAPGDVIVVREEWAVHWMYDDLDPARIRAVDSKEGAWETGDGIWYQAGGNVKPTDQRGKWRPADTMPDWAVRTKATVVEVLPPVEVAELPTENIRAAGLWISDEDYEAPGGVGRSLLRFAEAYPGVKPTAYIWRVILTAADAAIDGASEDG